MFPIINLTLINTKTMKQHWELTYKQDGWEFTYAIVECIKPNRTKKWKELLKLLNEDKVSSVKYSSLEHSL